MDSPKHRRWGNSSIFPGQLTDIAANRQVTPAQIDDLTVIGLQLA
jgi:hypothetical protein